MPRKEIKNEELLKRLVEEAGGYVRKVRWLAVNGAPDRLCMFPRQGRHAYVEVKEADQDWGLQGHQEREHLRMKASGMDVWVMSTEVEVRAFVKEMTR